MQTAMAESATPRRGRPRKAETDRLEPLTTSLDAETYAALCRLARAQRTTVAAVARDLITRRTKRADFSQ